MDIKITPAALKGEIFAPPSKSYAHRLLIGAFLTGGKVAVHCSDLSKDVLATAGALSAMGASVLFSEGVITVERGALPCGSITVDCNESGSSLRFLMPLAAALGLKATFTGAKRLLERPLTPLISVLNQHGADISGFTVNGKLSAGRYEVDASLSSQYVTGLLFALAALDESSELAVKGERVSAGYIDITLDVLKNYGADITEKDGTYYVNGGVKNDVREVYTEGDWSNAAFALTAGAIGGDVRVKGLNLSSRQGDRAIFEVLKKFGANIFEEDGAVRAVKSDLSAVDVDIDGIPDLAQIISVAASYAKGTTRLRNVDRLRLKESDRIAAIINTLCGAGISAEYKDGDLYITGGAPAGGTFDGGNDHRTVMSAAVLAANAKGASVILGAEASQKSYPSFFRDINALGGMTDVRI